MERVQINYTNRDFNSIKSDLISYLRTFYPDQWQDFNVASPGMALLELNAYVGDLLSNITDKKFIELYRDGAQSRESIYRLAKTKGYKIPGNKPAITIVDVEVEVPVSGDGPDDDYIPTIRRGMQVKGAGQIFETENDIDFSNDFSENGFANRRIEPILNGNQELLKYKIIKREEASAGVAVIYKQVVGDDGGIPFFKLELPDSNVLDIVSVIIKNGTSNSNTPTYSEFNSDALRFYEVDYLPQDHIFVENESYQAVNGVKVGYWKEVKKRFEKEFQADGKCVLTFGGGEENYDAYSDYLSELTSLDICQGNTNLNISNILENNALGVKVPKNSTIYVKYRVGGGSLSNVGANVLNQVSNVDAVITGADTNINANVISSVKANNPIPALGGKGEPSIEEIRYNLSANHAAQERCVTLNDYTSRAYQMPGKYGGPFRVHATVDDNKVKFYILTRDGNGKLVSSSTSRIKQNLVDYISKYRMINDFVEVNDGKVVNLRVYVDLFINRTGFNAREIKEEAIREITSFFDVQKWQMNEHVYISQLTDILREIPGVINVVDISFTNMEDGGYSSTRIDQAIGSRFQIPETGGFETEIQPIDNAIFSTPISMFEVKFPERDIFVRVA